MLNKRSQRYFLSLKNAFSFSNKKAQTEFIGIALIIVLLLLGTLLLYFFSSSTNNNIAESQLGSNFLGALIETSTDCNKLNIKRLLQDCNFQHRLFCPESSCVFAEEKIKLILNKTFDENRIEYFFNLTGEYITFSQGKSCSSYDYSEYRVPETEIKLSLSVCQELPTKVSGM